MGEEMKKEVKKEEQCSFIEMELSSCEKMVLSCIYEYQRRNEVAPDLTSILEMANAKFEKDWKVQTVCTFLTRMEKKGLITIEKRRRNSRYIPVISREEYLRQVFGEVSKLYFNDNKKQLRSFVRKNL